MAYLYHLIHAHQGAAPHDDFMALEARLNTLHVDKQPVQGVRAHDRIPCAQLMSCLVLQARSGSLKPLFARVIDSLRASIDARDMTDDTRMIYFQTGRIKFIEALIAVLWCKNQSTGRLFADACLPLLPAPTVKSITARVAHITRALPASRPLGSSKERLRTMADICPPLRQDPEPSRDSWNSSGLGVCTQDLFVS